MKLQDFDVKYIESMIEHPVLWESHCHGQFEMIAVVSGDITVMTEGQPYRLQKNQVLIIPPLFYHSVTANEKGRYRRITALFGLDAIPMVLQKEFSGQGRASAAEPSQITKLAEVCQREDPAFYAPLLQSLMTEILYDTLQMPQALTGIETDEFLQTAFA